MYKTEELFDLEHTICKKYLQECEYPWEALTLIKKCIKELIEGDVISMTSPPWVAWIPSNSFLEVLGIYPCAETVIPQLILTAITIATFIYWNKKNKELVAEAKKAQDGQTAPRG